VLIHAGKDWAGPADIYQDLVNGKGGDGRQLSLHQGGHSPSSHCQAAGDFQGRQRYGVGGDRRRIGRSLVKRRKSRRLRRNIKSRLSEALSLAHGGEHTGKKKRPVGEEDQNLSSPITEQLLSTRRNVFTGDLAERRRGEDTEE